MITPDALAATSPVVKAFAHLGVRYYVGGSAASSVFGRGRSTMDVDLVADLRPEHVGPLVEALRSTYYLNARTIAEAVARKSCFNVIHLPTSFKVDVFVLKDRPYDRAALDRCRSQSLLENDPDSTFAVASPEDIILSKLEWYRLGDEVSEIQWMDVLGILQLQQAALDRAYLRHWAAELGVADLLEKVWREVGR